jgi:hypothetical protein
MQDYTRALECNPRYADALARRGVAFTRKGAVAEAAADLRLFVEIAPGDPMAPQARAWLEENAPR